MSFQENVKNAFFWILKNVKYVFSNTGDKGAGCDRNFESTSNRCCHVANDFTNFTVHTARCVRTAGEFITHMQRSLALWFVIIFVCVCVCLYNCATACACSVRGKNVSKYWHCELHVSSVAFNNSRLYMSNVQRLTISHTSNNLVSFIIFAVADINRFTIFTARCYA